jgi:hypothetical protein
MQSPGPDAKPKLGKQAFLCKKFCQRLLAGIDRLAVKAAMSRESFSEWALASERTLEERYGALFLIEQITGLPIPKNDNWSIYYEAQRQYRRERELNPAYEPEYSAETARMVEERLPTLKKINSSSGDDRILRDLSWMRFCPAVDDLNLPNTEVNDWSPIAHLQQLKVLWVKEQTGWNFAPLGSLENLETLRLYLHAPWPDLSEFGRLRSLKALYFHGNPLALQGSGELPAVRHAEIDHWLSFKVPLRSLHDLPAMPELRKLHLINTWRLDGIERSPHLVNAEIYGYFEDLAPLQALQELTHLVLSGGEYETLEPLTSLPKLHYLLVRNEQPKDYSPLAEMPSLHEVEVESCPASKLEVASFNAGLPPWSDLFALPEPRPVPPLRLLLGRKGSDGDEEEEENSGPEKRDYGENEKMSTSEARWFAREVNRRLNGLLGRGWGKCDVKYASHPGDQHLDLFRMEDIDQLPKIVQSLRSLLCEARHPWVCRLMVDTMHRYERDMDEIEADDEEEKEKEFDAERERADWEYHQQRARERREFLERQHRLRLQKELGAPIRPEDFAPPKNEEEEETATAGGVEDQPSEYDLGTELRIYLTITERACHVAKHSRALAEMLLEVKAEEPEPEEPEPEN